MLCSAVGLVWFAHPPPSRSLSLTWTWPTTHSHLAQTPLLSIHLCGWGSCKYLHCNQLEITITQGFELLTHLLSHLLTHLRDLSYNAIEHLGPDSLPHLPHLTTLHLKNNRFFFNFCISCIVLFSCFCSTSESSFFCLLIKTIYFRKIWKLYFLICKFVLETALTLTVLIFARCKTPLCNLPLDMEKHFTSVRWTQCIVHCTLHTVHCSANCIAWHLCSALDHVCHTCI